MVGGAVLLDPVARLVRGCGCWQLIDRELGERTTSTRNRGQELMEQRDRIWGICHWVGLQQDRGPIQALGIPVFN